MNPDLNSSNTEPLDYLDGAKVIMWAWSGHQPFGFMGEEEVFGLAICQYEGSHIIYRFSCDKNWEVIQDGVYDTAENAINFLPNQYKNVVANWLFK